MITGSCHCGGVQLTAPKPDRLTHCNCSICRRIAGRWAYYARDQVTVTGETDTYVQGDRTLALHRCRICGCTTHWIGLDDPTRIAINARMMPTGDLADVPVRRFDGADTWTFLT